MSKLNPFLILCSASSGSSLLGMMLDRHPDLAIGPETYVLNKDYLYSWPYDLFCENLPSLLKQGRFSRGYEPVKSFFINRDAYFVTDEKIISLALDVGSLREFIDGIFLNFAEIRGKHIWGERTGSNSFFLDKFMAIFPNCRIIHLVRDPIDVIHSIRRRGTPLIRAVSHYLYNHCSAVRFAGQANYLRIKYEDLVRSPENVLALICDHLGVPQAESMMTSNHSDFYWREQVNLKSNFHPSWYNQPLDKISTSSIDKGREKITNSDLSIIMTLKLSQYSKNLLQLDESKHYNIEYLINCFGYQPVNSQESISAQYKMYCDFVRYSLSFLQNKLFPQPPLFSVSKNI